MKTSGKGPFVLHASVVLTALMGEADADIAEGVIAAIGSRAAVVPAQFGLEVADRLARETRRGAISEADAIAFAREVGAWPVVVDEQTAPAALNRSLALAFAHRISAPDAAYLEICLRRGLPLATFDPRLAAVARVHAVGLEIAQRKSAAAS
jgi:predicted nucleic acid-binding protein